MIDKLVEKHPVSPPAHASAFANFGSRHKSYAAAVVRNCQPAFSSPCSLVFFIPPACFIQPKIFSISGRLPWLIWQLACLAVLASIALPPLGGVLRRLCADLHRPHCPDGVPRGVPFIRSDALGPALAAPLPSLHCNLFRLAQASISAPFTLKFWFGSCGLACSRTRASNARATCWFSNRS